MENAIGDNVVLGLTEGHGVLSEGPHSVLDDCIPKADPDGSIFDAWQMSFSDPAAPSIRTTRVKPDQMH